MKTACIIQARLGSTRLPAKVLLPLPTGRTVLEEVLTRCQQIPGIDLVVLARPASRDNDILTHFRPPGVESIAPPVDERDVLGRYAAAAAVYGADIIMRVTADCPLIDPKVCEWMLGTFMVHQDAGIRDYCSNTMPRTWPQGLDCQIFTRDLLKQADGEATSAYDREHVCTWMERSSVVRRVNLVDAIEDRSHLRWTLDTLEDYVRIWRVFEEQMRAA